MFTVISIVNNKIIAVGYSKKHIREWLYNKGFTELKSYKDWFVKMDGGKQVSVYISEQPDLVFIA